MVKVLAKSTWDNKYYGQFLPTLSQQKWKIVKTQEKLNKKYSLFIIFNKMCTQTCTHIPYRVTKEKSTISIFV